MCECVELDVRGESVSGRAAEEPADVRPFRHRELAKRREHRQYLSVLSIVSAGSILSIGSAGSILSIGSAGSISILSIGSSGSILCIGSAGSVLSIGGRKRDEPDEP